MFDVLESLTFDYIAKPCALRKRSITVDGSTRSGDARKRACEDNYYI